MKTVPKLGEHQRQHFDRMTVPEALSAILATERELRVIMFASTQAAIDRRAELDARIAYLKYTRLLGRTYELFTSIGQVHATDCPVARSVTCAVAIECKHGYSVCPECDVCDCSTGKVKK